MIKIIRNLQKKIGISAIHLITDHRLLITAAAALPLAGCMGIYEGGFECPAGVGVGCKSISEVNMMVNQGELPKSHIEGSFEENETGHKCATCGHSFPSLQGKPEIWINPLYFKTQKEKTKELNRQKAFHGTISL